MLPTADRCMVIWSLMLARIHGLNTAFGDATCFFCRSWLVAPSPWPCVCSNVAQGAKEQKAALDLLLQPENAGKARPQLVAACAFALG